MANSTVTPHGMNPVSMVVHLGKTIKLVGAIFNDPRIHWLPKAGFAGTTGLLLAALLFPEVAGDIVGFALTGGVGDVFGIPAEAAVDWMAFSVASWKLLQMFPAEIVNEHYNAIFHGN